MEPVFESGNDFNAETSTSSYTRAAKGTIAGLAFITFDSANSRLDTTSAYVSDDGTDNNSILFNSAGDLVQLTELSTGGTDAGKVHTFNFGSASLLERGSAHNLTWGRWSAGYTITTDGVEDDTRGPFHYIYTTTPASLNDVTNSHAASSEQILIFDRAQNLGTTITDQNGTTGSFEYASLVLNLTRGKVERYDIKTVVGSLIFDVALDGDQPSIAAVINNTDSIQLSGTCSGPCGNSAASGGAGFAFADTNGNYIGSSFSVHDDSRTYSTYGTLVFERVATQSSPQVTPGNSSAHVVFIGNSGSANNDTKIITGTGTNQVTRSASYNGIGNVIVNAAEGTPATRDSFESGRAQLVDTGGNSVGVNWGRWTDGWNTNLSGAGAAPKGHAHFIYSDTVTADAELINMPTTLGTSTANFNNLIGGTSPTDQFGNVGTLNSASADVTFNGTVSGITVSNYNVNFTLGGRTFDMVQSTAVGLADARSGLISLQDSGDTNTPGSASLQLIGTNASHAISGYTVNDSNVQAVGTVLLQR